MLLTDIATAQPHFLNDLGSLRASYYFHDRFPSVSITLANEQKFFSPWKNAKQKNVNFKLRQVELQRGPLLVKAVATLDPKSEIDINPMLPDSNHPSSDDSVELDEREKTRRMRISKANKGNTPWNKGKKHSPETLQRIRERTRFAMQNPKVKKKLIDSRQNRSYSEETRMKISLGVRMGWEKLRGKQILQETCYFQWKNWIAEAARQGYSGEEQLQWNSYEILDEQLKQERLERLEQKKTRTREPSSRRAPKTAEQRKKISEAIAARWANPGYRERVCSALEKYYSARPQREKKPRRKQSEVTSSTRRTRTKKKAIEKEVPEVPTVPQKLRLTKRYIPVYKDPLVGSKLELIKNIRAQREAAKSKETEALRRARLLIAEADKAAKALEVAATKSPVAYASLIESRKLIAEAVRTIKSIEARQVTDQIASPAPLVNGVTMYNNERLGGSTLAVQQQPHKIEINGKSPLAYSTPEKSNSHSVGDIPLAKFVQPTNSSGCYLSVSSGFKSKMKGLGVASQLTQPEAELSTQNTKLQTAANGVEIQSREKETVSKSPVVTKRWVCGRLVEVEVEA